MVNKLNTEAVVWVFFVIFSIRPGKKGLKVKKTVCKKQRTIQRNIYSLIIFIYGRFSCPCKHTTVKVRKQFRFLIVDLEKCITLCHHMSDY